MSGLVGKELEESSRTLASIDPKQIWDIANALVKVFRAGGKLIVFGNGGSAADAQHLAAEFSGRYLMERAPMNAIALTNLSSITAIGNDYSYDLIFSRQVEAYATDKDAVIGISTSGNSKNVLLAIAKAKQLGAVTIGFTGTRGRLKDEVDLALTVPSEKTPRIQEGYFASGHIICGLVEKGVFGRKAVFIDRDDTVAKDVPYCSRPEDLKLFPGVGRSIKELNDAGYLVILVTNQSGVARGYFSLETLDRIHAKLKEDVAADGGSIDAVYFCPHHPDDRCQCRKPQLGLIEQAMRDFDIDLAGSFVIGDSEHDVEMGRKAGCRTFRVRGEQDFNLAVVKILNGID
ncbi:MAG TPA: HAD-IIIA family hydrolase [Methanomassiliicoccales archaeon]|jgi:D-sedoheptulose 7-phosphate isomerase